MELHFFSTCRNCVRLFGESRPLISKGISFGCQTGVPKARRIARGQAFPRFPWPRQDVAAGEDRTARAADRPRPRVRPGRGSLSRAALARGVLCRRLSADVPLAPAGRAADGAVPEGIRQGHGDDQRRQRGDGRGHGACRCGPGRDVVSLLHRDFAAPPAAGRDAVPVGLPVHGQRRKPDARPRRQRPSRRRGRAPFPDDQPPGQDAQPGGRRHLGGTAATAKRSSAWPSSATAAAAPASSTSR